MNDLKKTKKMNLMNPVLPLALLSAFFLTACSSDDGYTKKVRGTEDYLDAPSPKPLNIPASITLPSQNSELELALPAQQGNFGFNVDITPPSVGLTSADAGNEAEMAQDSYSEELYQGKVNVISGSDDTGLPVIIVEQAHAQTWQSLPNVFKNAGFEITEQNEALGKLTVDFKGVGSDSMPSSKVDSGEYTLQVGDLGNRTSLQFRTKNNTYLTQSQNDALQKLLENAFNK